MSNPTPPGSNSNSPQATTTVSGNMSKVLGNLPVHFPEFSGRPGTMPFSEFYDVFQAKANGRGSNEQQTGTALMGFLTGPALSFVNRLPDQTKSFYLDLVKALADRFDLSEEQTILHKTAAAATTNSKPVRH
uniref:DUF4939 domain-containing protein n=1 Tax=Steinernema glaseri TaxID=37863 RepID=A0A1I7YMP1_9BILA